MCTVQFAPRGEPLHGSRGMEAKQGQCAPQIADRLLAQQTQPVARAAPKGCPGPAPALATGDPSDGESSMMQLLTRQWISGFGVSLSIPAVAMFVLAWPVQLHCGRCGGDSTSPSIDSRPKPCSMGERAVCRHHAAAAAYMECMEACDVDDGGGSS